MAENWYGIKLVNHAFHWVNIVYLFTLIQMLFSSVNCSDRLCIMNFGHKSLYCLKKRITCSWSQVACYELFLNHRNTPHWGFSWAWNTGRGKKENPELHLPALHASLRNASFMWCVIYSNPHTLYNVTNGCNTGEEIRM